MESLEEIIYELGQGTLHESGSIEFKRDLPHDISQIAKIIVGIANNQGGYLIVGVQESNKGIRIIGVTDSSVIKKS